MSANWQKTWLTDSLNRHAERKSTEAINRTTRALPCSVVSVSGAIVTVKFEVQSGFTLPQVTIPLFGPIYIRYPIQPGDKGMAIPADTYLGGMSGLGGGVANLTQRANLTALVFLPFGNTEWSAVDPQAVTVYGPNGVVLRDTGSNSTFVLTPQSITMVGKNSVTISSGSTTMTLNESGAWSISGTGEGSLEADAGLTLKDRAHSTSITGMNAAWAALVTWINGHEHVSSASGSSTSAPTAPFTGANIAP